MSDREDIKTLIDKHNLSRMVRGNPFYKPQFSRFPLGCRVTEDRTKPPPGTKVVVSYLGTVIATVAPGERLWLEHGATRMQAIAALWRWYDQQESARGA